MKISVINYGCKVNQYEGQSLINSLNSLGYKTSERIDKDSDVYIVNTCAVTNEAESKSRQAIAKINKANKNAKIIVCGCSSENNPEQFINKENVSFVKGVANRNEIIDKINNLGIEVDPLPNEYEHIPFAIPTRTRAYIKVQDGCNNFCSYCLIPYVRGRSRSRDVLDIKQEIETLQDVKEIVLVGINLSDYKPSLGYLVKEIDTLGKRIRFGSLEVGIINKEFLQTLKSCQNICDHFHLSLQSGSSKVLKEMNRHYTKEEYIAAVKLIKEYYPNAAITTDIIVGYPTELEDDFKETIDLYRQVEYMDAHIFKYSKRNRTNAEKLGMLQNEIVDNRIKRLEKIRDEYSKKYLESKVGTNLEVLVESKKEDEYFFGHSKNFIKIYLKDAKPNDIKNIRIIKLFKDGVLGE